MISPLAKSTLGYTILSALEIPLLTSQNVSSPTNRVERAPRVGDEGGDKGVKGSRARY